ncbi:hypothetical protein [Paraburkholderia tropica]|uniref:hypothetical protein n=1 Tax=Paraburkholderia tropica TaxID=92647 RepID=UPI002AB0560B|nr:hypothetical protein [Paraburkholderia tropica]
MAFAKPSPNPINNRRLPAAAHYKATKNCIVPRPAFIPYRFFAPIARSTSASHRKTKHQNGGARIMIQIVHAGVGCNYTSLTLAVVGIRHKF